MIVLEGTVLHDRFAASAAVGLFPRTHEFHFVVFGLEHRRAEVFENVDLADVHGFGRGLCQFDATAFGHDVNVFAGTIQEKVTHKAANHESALPA